MWRVPETLQAIEKAGDSSVLLELIESFQLDTASRMVRLHDALDRLDTRRLQAEAHSVHGAALQMGAEDLAELCQSVEADAPRMDWPTLQYQVKQAEIRFAEVRFAMSEYVNTRRRADVGECA